MKLIVPPALPPARAAASPDWHGTPAEFQPGLAEVAHVFLAFQRRYMGRPRAEVDAWEVEEWLARLQAAHHQLLLLGAAAEPDLGPHLVRLAQGMALLGDERVHIRNALAGMAPQAALAALNIRITNQFRLYRLHFASRPRALGRPALVERLVSSLQETRQQLVELASMGLLEASTLVRTLDPELAGLEQEAKLVAEAVRTIDPAERLTLFQAELMAVSLQVDRQFPSGTGPECDQVLMGFLCDRMGELELQVRDLRQEGADLDLAGLQERLDRLEYLHRRLQQGG